MPKPGLRTILMAALLLLAAARAGAAAVLDDQLKAAFVFNFLRYVEWPQESFVTPAAPITVCALGKEPLGGALSAIGGRQAQGRTVDVRWLSSDAEIDGCHALFIPESEQRRLATLLNRVAGRAVLTVSDIEGFTEAGGGIGLVYGEERLQFEVNLHVLGQARLRASAQMLKLARSIIGSVRRP